MPLQFVRTSSGLMVPVEGDNSGRVSVVPNGHYYGSFVKAPLPFGISGVVGIYDADTNLSAGANLLLDKYVPSGELWVITNCSMRYVGTVAGVTMTCRIVLLSTVIVIFKEQNITSGQDYDRQTQLVLTPDDNIEMRITGATAGDAAYFAACGYKIDIDV